ncbi:hypothetical protein WH52_11200 [Tenacibaculum holothuriorum]|uniref:Uncharacterized protein n=1 Tax=Tenacibaculum holothuriorum TaxID=1635173 RepID=A0A1Y2PAF6_9FLAO|nr:hypothetical protein [Tenacibaculum holothuriorum]OSY87436.1 hypothetical protein WH52_11200 [Tenacibaculum holothuriorum]
MKTSNVIFKILGYFIILGGLALLIFYALYPSEIDWEINSEKNDYPTEIYEYKEPQSKSNKPTTSNSKVMLSGKWKVAYKDLGGAMVYNIKKEGTIFNAYTYEVQDENGYGEKVSPLKTLIIKSFNKKNGKGIYKISYEGKKYDVPCKIKFLNKSTFELSYDYYGQSGVETWKKQK